MISLREEGSKIEPENSYIEIGQSGVLIYKLENSRDDRGGLAIVDFSKFKPFLPQRVFYSYGVPKEQTRGKHAHKKCLQFFISVGGECTVEIDNGHETHQVRLDSPIFGIFLPPMVWSSQFDFSENACLLVLASEFYSEDDYVRDYDKFKRSVEISK